MKRYATIIPIAIVTLLCLAHPRIASAQDKDMAFRRTPSTETIGASLRLLAPTQRDINIAITAVILGNLLVGYERITRQGNSKRRHTPNDRD